MDTIFSSYLQPVCADRPCGDDLSFSAEFDRIQEARREDDPTIDYGEWKTTLKQADWDAVTATCTTLLQTRSKDLRLVAWLSEGLVKTRGLPGLADGIEITMRLVDAFGTGMHPGAAHDDQEQRIGALSWFALRMTQLARQAALTRSAAGAFSLADHETAVQLQRSSEPAAHAADRPTLEKFAAAAAGTDKSLYRQWLADVDRGIAALAQLEAACDRLFGNDGPSFTQFARCLDAIRERMQSIANDIGLFAPESAAGSGQAAQVRHADHVAAAALPVTLPGPIRSREQALDALRQVAAFFRHAEPHSPVAYLADKAAQWGAMPLHAWLRSVVKDGGTLARIEEMLGVEPQADPER